MLEADQFYLCENFTAMLASRTSACDHLSGPSSNQCLKVPNG